MGIPAHILAVTVPTAVDVRTEHPSVAVLSGPAGRAALRRVARRGCPIRHCCEPQERLSLQTPCLWVCNVGMQSWGRRCRWNAERNSYGEGKGAS